MKKIIASLLIIIGVCIICISYYISYKVEKDNKYIVTEYKKIINSKEKNEEAINLNEDLVGILKIPSIDIEVAIEKGTDQETLKYAVGHFKDTALPGQEGNFAVAGHRAYTYNKFFSNLDKVQIGDYIEILNNDGLHKYKVTSSEVVKPEQLEVLEQDLAKKTITLVTCTPKYIGSDRLIIKGELE